MQAAIEIRVMTKAHLVEVTQVHSAAFKGFFLTLMGKPFLRHYYNTVLEYQRSIALIAVDKNSRVVGLAVGFKNPTDFYYHFRENRIRMLPALLLGLFRRPWLGFMILRNVSRIRKSEQKATEPTVELASICSIVQNQQVGTTLLNAFLSRAQHLGVHRVTLTTDERDNSIVRKFYERHGFIEQGREHRGRRTLVAYSLELTDIPVVEVDGLSH